MKQVLTLIPFVAALALGCGGKSKEQEVMDRMAAKPKPGYVRVLNLGAVDLRLMQNGRLLGVAPANAGGMKAGALPAGEQTVSIEKEGKQILTPKLTIASNEVQTIVIRPDASYFLIEGEMRRPSEDANVSIVVLDESGKPVSGAPSFTVKGLLGNTKLDGAKVRLNNGDWSAAGGPLAGSAKVNIEDNCAYTMLFLKQGGSYKPYFMLNTPNDKPVAVGAQ